MPLMFNYRMFRCWLRFVYFFVLRGGGKAFVMEGCWGVCRFGGDIVGCSSGMGGVEGCDTG